MADERLKERGRLFYVCKMQTGRIEFPVYNQTMIGDHGLYREFVRARRRRHALDAPTGTVRLPGEHGEGARRRRSDLSQEIEGRFRPQSR